MIAARLSWQLMVGLAAANVLAWAFARFVFLQGLQASEVWQGQMGLAQALLLFDTLILAWVYTAAAWEQVDVMMIQRSDQNKPLVITSWQGHDFVINNIGPGPAVNVYVVVPMGPHAPRIHPMGALAASMEALIPTNHLMVGQAPANHVVLAEALSSRTQQWSASLNVLTNGLTIVRARFAEFPRPSKNLSRQQFLERYWPTLLNQLKVLTHEVEEEHHQ